MTDNKTPVVSAIENLTTLETLAAIICESGGGRFLRLERVKGRPALVLFCAANVRHESQTPVALPITELSADNVKKYLLAVEESQPESNGEAR